MQLLIEKEEERDQKKLDFIKKQKGLEYKKVQQKAPKVKIGDRVRSNKTTVNKDEVYDTNTQRYGAPKIYQYTSVQKQRLCFEDEEFMSYIKNNFPSLKNHSYALEDHYGERKHRHNRNQMNILYPETSILDTFME